MTSRHLVDPQIASLIDVFAPITAQLSFEALPAMRAQWQQMLPELPSTADPAITRSEQRIPGPKGAPDVRVLVYRPTTWRGPLPGYLHIHGGGYVVGSPEMSDARNRHIVSHVGCIVVAVAYRLAPETPHPGPIEDCYAALKWLHENAEQLGVDRNRIALGGESAGGGLSAALALLARDRSEVPVVFQMLSAPVLDDRTCIRIDPHPYAGEFVWTHKTNYLGWKALLGCEPGSRGVSPYASAARAEDLSGLPPAFISVGALDLLLEEDLEYARRLTRARVPMELHVYPGGLHGFELVADSHLAQEASRTSLLALRRALHGDMRVDR